MHLHRHPRALGALLLTAALACGGAEPGAAGRGEEATRSEPPADEATDAHGAAPETGNAEARASAEAEEDTHGEEERAGDSDTSPATDAREGADPAGEERSPDSDPGATTDATGSADATGTTDSADATGATGSASGEPADAEPSPDPQGPDAATILALPGSHSRSVRGPSDGAIEGSVPLPLRGPGFRFNPRRDPAARYGTVELLQALIRAAATVDRALPGGELTINDLSYEAGGAIPHHGSHRAGRDVDVLFYLLHDETGAPFPSVGAPLDPDGRGTDYRDLADPDDDVPVRIDLPRTWRFVQALIEQEPDDGAPLARIFVAEHLRTLLLEEAERAGAPDEVVQRFAELTCQPSYPHDDHFHFRFFCSREDMASGCEDTRPFYPWRLRALRAHDLRPRLHRPRPDRPRAPVTTSDQARAAAGAMHPSVRAFLDRREAWMDPPRTGRRFCR
ncbi:MAG TPA: penicillin-insensitive murein endopeptidase [Polyangiaceae bacterium LLY-WYZ-15_(1-7)]|nr:hypothetical protein [Sandaracinus sp.]HJL03167.1 penicillin-insensitive murein endopeptidase [Polyangiaceae bacterium LLY-WYZ-15_(1-7)]HJL10295.1 penicillin-insensitive murein endopeptidase [Polyangiaceae bacterium LLY-WYZ-15_(1-7)]HJL36262.1 penicillin-insensitive murein endopeptidase [Polyangiaceae bacterium LLY-WYZ-15_(1-7)]